MEEKIELTASPLKQGLIAWAKENGVKTKDFAFEMGYSPNYAWKILRGNKQNFTVEAFGHFVFAYGSNNAQEVLRLAGFENGKVEVPNSHKNKCAEPVPLVKVEKSRAAMETST